MDTNGTNETLRTAVISASICSIAAPTLACFQISHPHQGAIIVEEDMINGVIRRAAMRCKKRRRKKLYGLAKKTLKHNEENIRSLKLILNTAQFGLDR